MISPRLLVLPTTTAAAVAGAGLPSRQEAVEFVNPRDDGAGRNEVTLDEHEEA